MAVIDSTAVITPGPDYNTDVRPGLGGTFPDVEFSETIKQLSAIGASNSADDMYAHCWANADGTMYFHNALGQLDIRRTTDAALVAGNQPGNNFDTIWHPTNPDYYLYRSGTSLICRSVSGQNTVWSKNFGATLGSLGGSINWCDKTGRYFVVSYSSGGHVYDQVEDAIYSGTISSAFGAGYLGMTPDGAYVVFTDSTDFYSQALDHGANSIASPVMFMRGIAASSDHAVYLSASDGFNYAFSSMANLDSPDGMRYYYYRIDVNRAGMSEAQILSSVLATGGWLIEVTNTNDLEAHFTHGPNGLGQDWVFIDTEEQGGDNFNDGTYAGWRRYEQEIIGMNILTGEVRRYCHHRSRSITSGDYYRQPRISSAWDASLILWTSNMNDSSPAAYNDTFGIEDPLGVSSDVTPPTLSSPTSGTPTANGCTGAGVTTNEGNGTLYWAVVTNGGSCTDAQLKAGAGGNIVAGQAGNQSVPSSGAKTIATITGLAASTTYQLKFLHRDAAGNDSAQASANLTTTAGGGARNWRSINARRRQ